MYEHTGLDNCSIEFDSSKSLRALDEIEEINIVFNKIEIHFRPTYCQLVDGTTRAFHED